MRSILLFSLLLLVSSSFLFAQTELILSIESPVNTQIIADREGGSPADVYVAETGQVYYFDATLIVNFDLHIKGQSSDWIYNQASPSIFLPIPDGAGVVNAFVSVTTGGSFTLENVLCNGNNPVPGKDILGSFMNESGATKIILDNCSFSDVGGNILQTDGNPDIVSITNCVFMNSIEHSARPWGGHLGRFNTLGPELILENNTFVNSGRLLGNGGHFYESNITMNHNSWLNVLTEAVELHYNQALYANNIWYNWCWFGRTPADVAYNYCITTFETFNGLALDSVSAYWGGNLLYRDPAIKEHYDTELLAGGAEVLPYIVWNVDVDSTVDDDDNFTLGKHYWDIDPEFTTGPGNLDGMLDWLTFKYVDLGVGEWPNWLVTSPVTYDGDGLPVINWPPAFNLSYANTGLQTAATDGLPVGDLNWWPAAKATYDANRATYIAALVDSIFNATSLYTPGDAESGRITEITAIEDFINGPSEFSLSQNYPNPFNPTTSIAFKLDKAEKISMKVYDITGQLVKTVIENKNYNAGSHVVTIDMSKHSTGVYFTVLNNGSQELVRKMMLLK